MIELSGNYLKQCYAWKSCKEKARTLHKEHATHLQFEETRWIKRRLLEESSMDRQDQNRIFDLNEKSYVW